MCFKRSILRFHNPIVIGNGIAITRIYNLDAGYSTLVSFDIALNGFRYDIDTQLYYEMKQCLLHIIVSLQMDCTLTNCVINIFVDIEATQPAMMKLYADVIKVPTKNLSYEWHTKQKMSINNAIQQCHDEISKSTAMPAYVVSQILMCVDLLSVGKVCTEILKTFGI